MIMRVYHCTVVAGKDAEFREFAYSKSHPWLRQQRGLIAFYAGKPLPGSGERARCMVQIWKSEADLQAAFGDTWQEPRKLPDDVRDILESASVKVYELADEFRVDPDAST